MERMKNVLETIRKNPPQQIDGQMLTFDDFSVGLRGLPKSDVLRFQNDDFRMIIRPSGTEPKMKVYLQAVGETVDVSEERLEKMRRLLAELIR